MEQLVFELAVPEPPSFANFLAGRNAELVDALLAFVTGGSETGWPRRWQDASGARRRRLRA
jgi:hypothetical protein